jgi:hypothetical protein
VKICLAFTFFVLSMIAQGADTTRVDLQKSLLMEEAGKFVPHNGEGRSAYLKLENVKPGLVEITGKQPFSVFVNNRLQSQSVLFFRLPILENESSVLSVFSSAGISHISIQHLSVEEPDVWQQNPKTVSNALIILAGLLIAILIMLARTTGNATIEYLNFIKLFSVRGTEDSALTIRITSTNNVFFYLFCSALAAVNLFVLYSGEGLLFMTFGAVIVKILQLMVLVFLVLVIKIMLINSLATLFKLTDFGPAQFYNYVRLLLISFIFCSGILIFLVMISADWVAWRDALRYFIIGMSLIFVGVTFLKLLARGGFTVFHLFSYLCASEIVPFIILLNLYFS